MIAHSLAIYDRLSVRLLSVFPAGKPIEDLAGLDPNNPKKQFSLMTFSVRLHSLEGIGYSIEIINFRGTELKPEAQLFEAFILFFIFLTW